MTEYQWRIELYETDEATNGETCEMQVGSDPCRKPAQFSDPFVVTVKGMNQQKWRCFCTEHALVYATATYGDEEFITEEGDVDDDAEALDYMTKIARKRGLRAIAHEPGDSGRVIAVFTGPTVGAVALQIGRSGLCQEPGNLLYLGAELARVAAKGGLS